MTRPTDTGQVAFERDRMIEVLVYHWRSSSSGCGCGWAELGRSHPEHVVDVYEQSVRASGQLIDEAAVRLSKLWDAERASWELRFDAPSYGNKGCWVLTMEWSQEYGNAHLADWSTHSWVFNALEGEGGPADVLAQAIEFCESLLPFKEDPDEA